MPALRRKPRGPLTKIQKVLMKLAEKNIRTEVVAAEARVSNSLVHLWKYGKREPTYVMWDFLKNNFCKRHGIRV